MCPSYWHLLNENPLLSYLTGPTGSDTDGVRGMKDNTVALRLPAPCWWAAALWEEGEGEGGFNSQAGARRHLPYTSNCLPYRPAISSGYWHFIFRKRVPPSAARVPLTSRLEAVGESEGEYQHADMEAICTKAI